MSEVTWVKAFLGLGSNLKNPIAQLRNVLQRFELSKDIELIRCSQFYVSKPLGPQDQPDFVNAVIEIRTCLEPLALLALTQEIERVSGRVKKRHWGERVIDIDLLVYAEQQIDLPTLTVPHPHIAQRDFVLIPLQEIAPDLSIPGLPPLKQMIVALQQTYVVSLTEQFEIAEN